MTDHSSNVDSLTENKNSMILPVHNKKNQLHRMKKIHLTALNFLILQKMRLRNKTGYKIA